jgi:signal transduction histidine kinase
VVYRLDFLHRYEYSLYHWIPMPSDANTIIIAIFAVTITVLGLFLFFVLMMVRNHRKIETAQREKLEQLQMFTDRMQSAREEEQKRIARELHDELGGNLTSLKYDFTWLEKRSTLNDEALERSRAMRELIDTTIKSVQRISSELRPKILDNLGLFAAIQWQVDEFQKRTGIPVTLHELTQQPKIGEEKTTGIYRMVQESFTNIARHSQSTKVLLDLHMKDGSLNIRIQDNGKGFDMGLLNHPESIGLLSMHERARMIGGSVKIQSAVGQGTTIEFTIPLPPVNELTKEASAA